MPGVDDSCEDVSMLNNTSYCISMSLSGFCNCGGNAVSANVVLIIFSDTVNCISGKSIDVYILAVTEIVLYCSSAGSVSGEGSGVSLIPVGGPGSIGAAGSAFSIREIYYVSGIRNSTRYCQSELEVFILGLSRRRPFFLSVRVWPLFHGRHRPSYRAGIPFPYLACTRYRHTCFGARWCLWSRG